MKTSHLPSFSEKGFGLTRECPIKLCLAYSSLRDSGENGSKKMHEKTALRSGGEGELARSVFLCSLPFFLSSALIEAKIVL